MTDTEREIVELRSRVDRLESQMAFLKRRLGISDEEAVAPQVSPRVLDLVRRGDRKGAMRAFMEETSASLSDAKRYVESLEA